jgi:hypothetical protein
MRRVSPSKAQPPPRRGSTYDQGWFNRTGHAPSPAVRLRRSIGEGAPVSLLPLLEARISGSIEKSRSRMGSSQFADLRSMSHLMNGRWGREGAGETWQCLHGAGACRHARRRVRACSSAAGPSGRTRPVHARAQPPPPQELHHHGRLPARRVAVDAARGRQGVQKGGCHCPVHCPVPLRHCTLV